MKKIDSRFHGNDMKGCGNDKKKRGGMGMTEMWVRRQ